NGSHGCINLPVKKAAELYPLLEKGMPIICHN
ncbi:MAG: L,D-transpeptidase, partial [Lachnospiraceae bacterium]|nr:L,D-transpeptidase [Lachnospiraceae bacterium]